MLLLLLLCENDEADYCVKGPTPRLSLLFWLRLFLSCTDACCNVVTSIDRDVIATCEHHVNTWYAVENVDVEHKIGMVVILQVNGRLLNAT